MTKAPTRRFLLQGVGLLLAGCGRGAPSGPTVSGDWNSILAAGRKEGQVLMYGGVFSAQEVKTVAAAFKKETGIDFDFLPITGASALTRIRQEAKVGRAPDIFEATGGWLRQLDADGLLLPLKDRSLPVWSESKDVWNIHPGYKASEWQYVLSRLRVRQGHLGVNTKLLAEKDWPSSWQDLAGNPKFRGALVLVDPSRSTSAGAELVIQGYIGKKLTPTDLWNIIETQKPMLVSVPRANVMSVAEGERALTFPPLDETALNLIEAGAPVKNIYFPDTPIFAETAEMGAIKSASHPNAALVFINWYLGKSGQTMLGDILLQTSVRRDVASTVPAAIRGIVVGGGTRGPIIIDTPAQTQLIQDFLSTGILKKLVDGSSAQDFDAAWTGFVKSWEASHGRQDQPHVLDMT